ncbi:MAG: pyrroline-5-carboxylate reductase [Candidatus Margulisiibacteriota bacterium]
MNDNNFGFIGFGNMGSAIAQRIFEQTDCRLFASDPDKTKQDSCKIPSDKITFCEPEGVFESCSIVFLAIKPQIFPEISSKLVPFIKSHHVIISMLAGINITSLEAKLNTTSLIRIMPNTPVAVGVGVSGILFHESLSDVIKVEITNLIDLLGQSIVLTTEDQMHAITAISGSGPAFFYRIINAIASFGVSNGLSREHALNAALFTMLGAGEMLKKTLDPSQLIQKVASPKGTTEAGLNRMDALEFDQLLQEVLQAASQRSEALSRGEK